MPERVIVQPYPEEQHESPLLGRSILERYKFVKEIDSALGRHTAYGMEQQGAMDR